MIPRALTAVFDELYIAVVFGVGRAHGGVDVSEVTALVWADSGGIDVSEGGIPVGGIVAPGLPWVGDGDSCTAADDAHGVEPAVPCHEFGKECGEAFLAVAGIFFVEVAYDGGGDWRL